MNYRQIVKNVPLFAGLCEPDLDDLMGIVRISDHPRGELLFSDGEKAAGFFIVLDGKVKVYKMSQEGKERILHIIQPGGTFVGQILSNHQGERVSRGSGRARVLDAVAVAAS